MIFLVFSIICLVKLAKAFGKDTGFAVGLIFLPIVFLPILAFSKNAVYVGPEGTNTQPESQPTQPDQFNQPNQF